MLIRNLNKILLIGTVLLAGNADSNFATASMLPVEYATDPTTDQTLRSSERVLKNRPSRIPEEYKDWISGKGLSITKKSDDLNNKGGRPELPDEQKSEKTQANIAAAG